MRSPIVSVTGFIREGCGIFADGSDTPAIPHIRDNPPDRVPIDEAGGRLVYSERHRDLIRLCPFDVQMTPVVQTTIHAFATRPSQVRLLSTARDDRPCWMMCSRLQFMING